jgi:NodT family efflux transporter outer membrane factor (OMF) lipoprotein
MKARHALAISLLLSGCMVGPKYVPPSVPAPPAFKESLPPAYNGDVAGAWQPANPQDATLKGKWWEIFNEPELNALEEQVNIDNQNIAQFFENFMAARAVVSEARAGLFPTVTANPAITKGGAVILNNSSSSSGSSSTSSGGKSSSSGTGTSSSSGSSSSTTSSTTSSSSSSSVSTVTGGVTLPFDVSWEPDLWGRVRNTIRQAQYTAQVSAADLENERLTEQADLAEYFFELRGEDTLQDISNRIVQAEQTSLDITRALVETGIDAPTAIPQAEITLANAQEAAVSIASVRAYYEHAIAMLIGKPASGFSMPVKALSTPLPPIPVGVPSELLQRRPDIAAAERTMAAANATIGIEKAAYYPSLSLTGSAGVEASGLSTLFSMPALFYSVGASAAQTLFDAGLRNATMAQYEATYRADVASYKQTILNAFQQVEDYIADLRVTSQELNRQQSALNSAQTYVTMETGRYDTGIDPYLDVISAQLTLLNNQQTQVELRINEMTQAVELIQSLGGGWNVSALPSPDRIRGNGAVQQVKDTP